MVLFVDYSANASLMFVLIGVWYIGMYFDYVNERFWYVVVMVI